MCHDIFSRYGLPTADVVVKSKHDNTSSANIESIADGLSRLFLIVHWFVSFKPHLWFRRILFCFVAHAQTGAGSVSLTKLTVGERHCLLVVTGFDWKTRTELFICWWQTLSDYWTVDRQFCDFIEKVNFVALSRHKGARNVYLHNLAPWWLLGVDISMFKMLKAKSVVNCTMTFWQSQWTSSRNFCYE